MSSQPKHARNEPYRWRLKRLQFNEKCTPNKPNKISDGNGLWLYVQHTGTKVFVSIYSHNGKQKEKTSGKYPALSLAQARTKNTEIKKQPAQGIDPKEVAKQAKIKQSDNRFDTFDKQWLGHPFHKKTA